MTTEYRDVPGFPGYRVGDDGSVLSCRSKKGFQNRPIEWRQLGCSRQDNGYISIRFWVDGQETFRYVHELVLSVFVGPRPPGMQCCHGNGTRTDNRLSNLRWATVKENCSDTIKHGRTTTGERNRHAKLTEGDVLAIRKRLADGEKRKAIADEFGVHRNHIDAIATRKFWASLPA